MGSAATGDASHCSAAGPRMKPCHPGGNCSLETLGRGCPAPGFVSVLMCPFSTRAPTVVTLLGRRQLYFRLSVRSWVFYWKPWIPAAVVIFGELSVGWGSGKGSWVGGQLLGASILFLPPASLTRNRPASLTASCFCHRFSPYLRAPQDLAGGREGCASKLARRPVPFSPHRIFSHL